MAFLVHPFHLATRGRYDGEYGIATRGYLICPKLVSRIAQVAEIACDELFAVITCDELFVEITTDDIVACIDEAPGEGPC